LTDHFPSRDCRCKSFGPFPQLQVPFDVIGELVPTGGGRALPVIADAQRPMECSPVRHGLIAYVNQLYLDAPGGADIIEERVLHFCAPSPQWVVSATAETGTLAVAS
jgi:hypothetical protein